MARHRAVRTMNLDDECYEEDEDYYGHSVEENYCISPATAAQFTFNRDHHTNLSSYMDEPEIPKVDPETDEEPDSLNASTEQLHSKLNQLDEAKLNSCLEEIRNILGETCPEPIMMETIIRNDYKLETALNELLTRQDAPKPQRAPRENRRTRSQASNTEGFKLKDPPVPVNSQNCIGNATDSRSKVTVTPKKQPIRGFEPSSAITDTTMTGGEKVGSAKNSNVPKKSDSGDRLSDNVPETEKSPEASASYVPSSVMTTESASELVPTPKKDIVDRPPLPKSSSKSKQKINVAEEYAKRQAGKELLNLVVIGHVDAGKSTLMGHLLYQLGSVNRRTMHKYEQESKKLGKGSFAFAWVLDETEEERTRGVTMDVAQTRFETPHKTVTLLDAPGHKDFIPNMITGAAQADVAILVINATKGEFETGFDAGGQTREHALLARSLGVSQIVVAVNKMDTVEWSSDRYIEIVKKIGQFLKQAGFRDGDVSFIPCSGLGGENLTETIKGPKLAAWYKGSTLAEQIDKFKSLERPIDKPLRLIVSDVFKGIGSGFSVAGRVGAGYIQSGDKVLIMPSSVVASVKGVLIDEESSVIAFAGDHLTVSLGGIDMQNVNIGSVLCNPTSPAKYTTRIRARVVIFNLEVPLTKGFPVVFHYQSINEPAVIKRLVAQLNKSTGEITKNRPKCLVKNSSAVVEIEFERVICIELYKDFKDLGRFMLRSGGATIAAGVVEEILPPRAKDD